MMSENQASRTPFRIPFMGQRHIATIELNSGNHMVLPCNVYDGEGRLIGDCAVVERAAPDVPQTVYFGWRERLGEEKPA